MENVPQVHSEQNIEDFNNWIQFLKSKGYQSAWKDLNAKDFGVAQNRERCFMISILSGDYVEYKFPQKQKLTKTVRDYLQEDVEEKYYINNEKANELIGQLHLQGVLPTHNRTEQNRTEQNRTDCCNLMQDCQHKMILDCSMIGVEGLPRIYKEIAPTLQARDYKEPRYVLHN